MILRPARVAGRISTARTQRGSVTGIGVSGLNQTSWPLAGMVYGSDLRMKSGLPNCFSSCQPSSFGHCLGGGMSFGSPSGAPASTQRAMIGDLIVGERHVVLEMLNSDRLVQMPGRHLAGHHALLDRLSPTAGFLRR